MNLRTGFAILGVFCAQMVWAGTLTPYNAGVIFTCLDQTGDVIANTSCSHGTVVDFGTNSVNTTLTAPGSTLQIKDSASGGYGTLHADSSTTLSFAGTTLTTGFTIAEGIFEDVMTVNFAPFTGEQGFMLLDYDLHGTTTASAENNAFGEVNIFVGANLEQSAGATYIGSVDGRFAVPKTFTFIYGQPFGLVFQLLAVSGTAMPTAGPSPGGFREQYYTNASGTSSSLFGDTLILSGITLEDSKGNPVTGASITSGSGTLYGPDGVVPEPSTFGLVLIPLAAVSVLRRRTSGVKTC